MVPCPSGRYCPGVHSHFSQLALRMSGGGVASDSPVAANLVVRLGVHGSRRVGVDGLDEATAEAGRVDAPRSTGLVPHPRSRARADGVTLTPGVRTVSNVERRSADRGIVEADVARAAVLCSLSRLRHT